MRSIIVATDFSVTSLNAANYAADMAKAVNGYLILLHVYTTPVVTTEIPVSLDTGALLSGLEEEMKKLEDMLVRRTSGKIIIETEVRMGAIFNELQEVCRTIQPYAVVMGSQGTTSAERFLFGAHTVHAMKRLEWPVIAVPPNVKFSSIKKIGLATDFNDVVEYTPIDELSELV
ncbi:MAG TPA: universal stress protein, partial [Ferruginibacter sp.]|nr:universal stress protein [Ferruginibacter sp.]